MTISSTTTTPPQTLSPMIPSHSFPLMTKLIENSIMTPPQNSYLISKRKRPQTMLRMLQKLLFLMINLIGNPMMMMIWIFICTRVLPLLLCLGNFQKISTTQPPKSTKQNTVADDATTTTDSIIFDKKLDQKLNDDDDLEIEYRQFAKPVDIFHKKYYCQKAHRVMITLFYPPRIVKVILIIVLWKFLDRHHHWIITDINPSTTISLPIHTRTTIKSMA